MKTPIDPIEDFINLPNNKTTICSTTSRVSNRISYFLKIVDKKDFPTIVPITEADIPHYTQIINKAKVTNLALKQAINLRRKTKNLLTKNNPNLPIDESLLPPLPSTNPSDSNELEDLLPLSLLDTEDPLTDPIEDICPSLPPKINY